NQACYQVIYSWGDREALKVIAKPLDLDIAEEDRNISSLTIRIARTGHRLKPSVNSAPIKVEGVAVGADHLWPLDGVSMDELARFLEIRYRRPVVNMTSLQGHWSIQLSHASTINWPNANERVPLDDLGLDLQWEQITIPVTVVRDKVK
ncbi:MAG: TIGR03435 family protein, partial [Planctomycetes bacterium]|nr:TIGR03435 family protein [Planctomycetota bacterium]